MKVTMKDDMKEDKSKGGDSAKYVVPTILGFGFDRYSFRDFALNKEATSYFNQKYEESTIKNMLKNEELYNTLQNRDTIWPDHVKNDPNFWRNSYYFDDEKETFLPRQAFLPSRKEEDRYYFDINFGIWRLKKMSSRWPGDYYFDDHYGEFYSKVRFCDPDDDYYYSCNEEEGGSHVWKKNGVHGPSVNGLRPQDYYFDPILGVWLKRLHEKWTEVEWNENGHRWEIRPRRKSGCGCVGSPDDFYFDETLKTFKVKELGQQYLWHVDWNVWRLKPLVGENSEAENMKNIQCVQDHFFDETDCIMKKKDGPAILFAFDSNNRVFRRTKVLTGRRNPRNWDWLEHARRWQYVQQSRPNCCCPCQLRRDYENPFMEYYGPYEESWKKLVSHDCPPVELNKGEDPWDKFNDNDDDWNEPDEMTSFIKKPCPRKTKLLANTGPITDDVTDSNVKPLHKICKRKIVPLDLLSRTEASAMQLECQDEKYNQKALKVSNLGGKITDEDFKKMFPQCSTIDHPYDIETRCPADYAYIEFCSENDAYCAYKSMKNKIVNEQKIKVVFKRD